jgi:cell division septal protein FtsQ
MPTTEITSEKIMTLFDDLINNYGKIQRKLASRVNEYRERQRKFAARINADIETLPEDKWAVQNNLGNTLTWGIDVFMQKRMRNVWKVWNRLVYSRLIRYMS